LAGPSEYRIATLFQALTAISSSTNKYCYIVHSAPATKRNSSATMSSESQTPAAPARRMPIQTAKQTCLFEHLKHGCKLKCPPQSTGETGLRMKTGVAVSKRVDAMLVQTGYYCTGYWVQWQDT
ncbi:MAG: hypothetical protein KAI17_08775, partial [Thiotrichaceae bacterium]|nr:hypothetical protein [Thiotrichaceae bacterium]